jgi:hypothetical protein
MEEEKPKEEEGSEASTTDEEGGEKKALTLTSSKEKEEDSGELDFKVKKTKRRTKPFMPQIVEETEDDLEEEMKDPEYRPDDDVPVDAKLDGDGDEPDMKIGDLTSLIKFEAHGRKQAEKDNQEQPLDLSTADMETCSRSSRSGESRSRRLTAWPTRQRATEGRPSWSTSSSS